MTLEVSWGNLDFSVRAIQLVFRLHIHLSLAGESPISSETLALSVGDILQLLVLFSHFSNVRLWKSFFFSIVLHP